MIIKINRTTYKLERSAYSFTLSKIQKVQEGKNKGEDHNSIIGYYSNINSAIKVLVNLHLLDDTEELEIRSVSELTELLKNNLNKLENKFEVAND